MKTEAKKYVVMCVGHTHTGKTTFARKLAQQNPDMVQLDSDEIAAFSKEKYPLLVESPYNKNQRDFDNLKAILFKEVYRFSLNIGNPIILSNGNLAKKFRAFVTREAKKQGYEVITVYFNIPEAVILQRLASTEKSQNVFIQSKSWPEVLERQKKYAELPPVTKNTTYFEIQNDADQETVIQRINQLLTHV